mgnify:CR=1 FL=1
MSYNSKTSKSQTKNGAVAFYGSILGIFIVFPLFLFMFKTPEGEPKPPTTHEIVMANCTEHCDHNLEILLTEDPTAADGTVSIRGTISKASRFFPIGYEVLAVCTGPCKSLHKNDNAHFFCTLKDKASRVESCEFRRLLNTVAH